MARRVTIIEHGRDGDVVYAGDLGTIKGYWAFGGGDVVTIVSMGSREDWRRAHAWAEDHRADILRFVADETIRQRAPGCAAEIDEESGDILLRQTADGAKHMAASQPANRAKAANFVRRYGDLRAMAALIVLGIVSVAGVLMWFGKQSMMVSSGLGVPLGAAVRFESQDPSRPGGVASLIQKTDPHLPNWSGRGGGETAGVSILLIPLDGSPARLIPVASGLFPGSISLARIIGSDGHTLWFDVAGLHGVRLEDGSLIGAKDLRVANSSFDAAWWDDTRSMDIVEGKLHIVRADRSAALDIDPSTLIATAVTAMPSNARFRNDPPADYLAAGLMVSPGVWLGLHSPTEMGGAFKPGKWIKAVESAEDAKQLRRLTKAAVETSADGRRHRVRTIAPIRDGEFLNAAFLRPDRSSEPLRLNDPDGALMLHTSAPGLAGTLVVSRVDIHGEEIWSVDTGLDRFQLQKIMPGPGSVAFAGVRLPAPGKVSEPLVVLIDHKTGQLTAHTLSR